MLPIDLPLTPMLARAEQAIPAGQAYEPKWDGWRALLARDGDDVKLWSRHGTDLTAYFPELVIAAEFLPDRCVLDGEIVVIAGDKLEYTRLATRHATAAKAPQLAVQFPASFICFDVLCVGDASLLDEPWHRRRDLLETILDEAPPMLLLSPVTTDLTVAQDWFERFEGAGLDGVVAKPLEGRYLPGQRALVKIKHRRTADVVVAGFRLDRTSTPERPQLGSLLLGLFDDAGVLQFIGITAGFPGAMRGELAAMFATLELPRRTPEFDAHPWAPATAGPLGARVPDHVTRWTQPRDEVHLTSPLLVAEVEYDYLHDGIRLRSNANFQRWRPDRTPESCRFDQLDHPIAWSLGDVLTHHAG